MKKCFFLSLSIMCMFGILFPVSSTGTGKSPFFEDIKKIFGYSSGVTDKSSNYKAPYITDKASTGMFKEIKNVFHYSPGVGEKAKAKEYPLEFDKTLEKELRYPTAQETK